MIKQHFSLQEVFKFGWSKTVQHAWFVVLASLIISVLMSAVSRTEMLCGVVGVLVGLSVSSVSLLISRGHGFSFEDLFTPLLSYKKVLKFFALVVLCATPFLASGLSFAVLLSFLSIPTTSQAVAFVVFILAIVSLVLLVASIYLMIRLKFFPFMVIEHPEATVTNLLKSSYALTHKKFLNVFLFVLLLAVLNLVAANVFPPLLIATIAISCFSSAHVYNLLKDHIA